MSKYKHLLFDVDGTIVDSFAANMDSLMDLLARHRPGHNYKQEDLIYMYGIPGVDGLKSLNFKDEEIPGLLYEWLELVIQHADECSLYPHVLTVLKCLKEQGYHMAVVTSRTRDGDMGGPLGSYLPIPIRPYITTAICAGDTPRPKPYPDPILKYMEMTGASRDEILFIGDAATDVQAAHAAGVDFAFALWGSHLKEHLYCKHYLRTPWDILSIVSQKEPEQSVEAQLHCWAHEINAIGQIGLTYVKDRFDKERYERLQEIANEMACYYVDSSYETIKKAWCMDTGYATPKVDTRMAIFDEQGRLLMVKEKNSGKWNMPGGWCDDGLSLTENAVKEVREEANMDVHVLKLIAVHERNRHNLKDTLCGVLKTFMECSLGPGEFVENIETAERRFFTLEEVKAIPQEQLRTSTNTLEQIELCFEAHKVKDWITVFD